MAAENSLEQFRKAQKEYQDRQRYLDELTQNQTHSLSDISSMVKEDNEYGKVAGDIKKLSANDNTEFTLTNPESKDARQVVNEYLQGKIKSTVPETTNYRALMESANDKLNNNSEEIRQGLLKTWGNKPSDWTTMDGEAYNPNLPQKFSVDKNKLDYSPLQEIGFDPQIEIQEAVQNKVPNLVINPQIQDISKEVESAPIRGPAASQSPKSNMDGGKSGNTGGGQDKPKELDPLAQFQQLLKLQEEKQAKMDSELAAAQSQRDINNALGMITSGISKAAAGYGGGSVTQLKGDTSAEEMLKQTADQKIADIKERMKTAGDTEKKVLERQLTLAQLQKMRDDKANDAEKLKIEREKLGLERSKLLADAGKAKLTPGQEAVDKEFGKQYAEYITKDKPRFENASKIVDGVISDLKSGKGTTGPVVGRLGPLTGDVFTTESLALQQKAQSAVLDMLKSTFPGAISNEERQVFFDNSYDRTLKPEQNIAKLKRIKQDIINKNESYLKSAEHFKKTGSLQGYEPTSNINKSPLSGQAKEAYDWAKANPNDPRSKQILQKLGM